MKTKIKSIIFKTTFFFTLVFTSMIGHSQCTVVTPGPVSGIKNVCRYVGEIDQLTYAIDPVPDATSYEWVIPANVTLISGQGTTSITLIFSNGFQFQANQQLRVRAIFPCGISSYRIFYLITQYPGTPQPIVASATNVCAYIGTSNMISYTIPSVAAASEYIWTTPAATTSVIHPEPPGPNDTTINVMFTLAYTSSSICVQSINNCGVSLGTRCFYVPRVVPPQPGLISGNTSVCANIAPSGTPATYSIPVTANISSYTWTTPPNCIVTNPNPPGSNDTSITVLYPAGFSNGLIAVSNTNNCGTSSRSLVINSFLPSGPGAITATNVSSCPGRIINYSVTALPINSTSLLWNVPAGGTIQSGQGTTLISVLYTNAAINGNVTATGVSNCGNSTPRTLAVNLSACSPFSAGTQNGFSSTARGSTEAVSISLQVSPNPTSDEFKIKIPAYNNATATIRILDISGRVLKTINARQNETVSFGNDLVTGSYILELTQGNNRRVQKLIKL